MKTLITFLFLTLSINTYARLDETRQQLVERFGEPTVLSENKSSATWSLGEISFTATFDENNISVIESIRPKSGHLSQTQTDKFLNSNGKDWESIRKGSFVFPNWTNGPTIYKKSLELFSTDGDLLAVRSLWIQGSLTVYSQKGYKVKEAKRIKDEEAKAIDF